ncbi:MAG: tRNA pseudouridine(55) synthase TruB [Candidatus Rokuibacteriota bacterium]
MKAGPSTRGRAASFRSGVLPVEKGRGVTSFDVVALVRRLLRAGKVGHAGTLDPDATGVLPLLIGEATKLMPYLADADKEYVATATLGVATDTQDLSGAVVATHPVPALDEASLTGILARFVGEIDQVPPMYSAIHHEGRRLYEIAREGGSVDRRARRVVVHGIALEGVSLPDFTMRVRCGKGTYVRTLVADAGAAIGCGAALSRLTRTRVGPFALSDAVPWAELSTCRDAAALWSRLLPPDAALQGRPALTLVPAATRAFTHGQAAGAPPTADGIVRVYGADGVFLGVGIASAGTVRPERLLHADPARTSVLPA